MKKKILLVLGLGLVVSPISSEIVLSANQTQSNYVEEQVYAPTHPTNEQVETAAATDLVTIPDTNLEQVLADELGVAPGEITVGEMETLESIDLSYRNIVDLTGLEYATNLTLLNIENNQISDLSPLAGLTDLTSLSLSYNQISDLSPLAGLTSLEDLDMNYNQISDLSPLAGLTNLTSLYMDSNQISDLSLLAGLTNLTSLHMDSNQISDLSPLASLTSLEDLYMNSNQISDISPLAGLTNLGYLSFNLNQITDLSPLASLTNLELIMFQEQYIYLDNIVVKDNNELFYTVVNIDGNEHQVSLGLPTEGTQEMYGEWYIDGPNYQLFSGMVFQTVTFDPTSSIIGDTSASTSEEVALTDEELITLFNVTNSDDLAITVDQSAVDYSTPGDYPIIFTDIDGNELSVMLTITDILPVLTVDVDTVTIDANSTIDDILNQLEISATEITDGDLTDEISYDDSAVDYASAGDYTVVFTVFDDEGNEVSKIIAVTILEEDTNTEIEDSEADNLVAVTDEDVITSDQTAVHEDNSNLEFTDATIEEEEGNYSDMTIATTGAKNTILIMVISTILIGLIYVKNKIAFKK